MNDDLKSAVSAKAKDKVRAQHPYGSTLKSVAEEYLPRGMDIDDLTLEYCKTQSQRKANTIIF
jgi:hypothetical protein